MCDSKAEKDLYWEKFAEERNAKAKIYDDSWNYLFQTMIDYGKTEEEAKSFAYQNVENYMDYKLGIQRKR